MKKILLFALICSNFATLGKGQVIKIYSESSKEGFIIYGDNDELHPTSVTFDFTLKNLAFSESESKIFVIPRKTNKFKIGEFKKIETTAGHQLSYKYRYTMGDVTISQYEKSFEYDLPFQKGKSYNVFQGYNGNFSHQDENAIDFTMPEGTEIVAAREGIVVKVVQSNTESCANKECEKYNNYITVMHSDGTFASYLHIKHNGAKFNLGDTVKRGDIIAYSGNVGWSSGPHLHFICFLGGFGKRNSLETKFKVNGGDKAILLQERNKYLRDY